MTVKMTEMGMKMTEKMTKFMPKGVFYGMRMPGIWAISRDFFNSLMEIEQDFAKNSPPKLSIDETGTATIKIEGVILSKDKDVWWGYETSQETIKREIDAALANENVKAIKLQVNSPGGLAVGTQELASYIHSAASVKPMYAEVDEIAASAAYWLASATGDVRSGPSSIVGSIGVYLVHTDHSKALEEYGIKQTYFTAGKYKAASAPKPLSETDMEALQGEVNHLYDNFKAGVAEYMGLDLAKEEEWADGRVFFGDQGFENGLVTSLLMPQKAEDNRSQEMAETQSPSADVQQITQEDLDKAVASAVSTKETMIMEIASVCLDETSVKKLKAALDSGMTSSQLKAAKEMFACDPKVVEQKESEDDKRDREFLANLSGAPAASNTPNKDLDARRVYLDRIGHLGFQEDGKLGFNEPRKGAN